MELSVCQAPHEVLCPHHLRPPTSDRASLITSHCCGRSSPFFWWDPLSLWGTLFSCGLGRDDSIYGHCWARKRYSPGHGGKDKNRLAPSQVLRDHYGISLILLLENTVSFGWLAKLVRYDLGAASGYLPPHRRRNSGRDNPCWETKEELASSDTPSQLHPWLPSCMS